VVQFKPVQQQFMDFGIVPTAVGREGQDRPFTAMVRVAKADLNIVDSFSTLWRTPTLLPRVSK
jgi:hypothetical protein